MSAWTACCARIDYLESAERVIFVYHPAFNPVAPLALLWSLSGGLAVGVGLSVGLVALGALPIQDGPQAFRTVLLGGTVIGALLLFVVGLVYALRTRALKIVFDYPGQRLLICPPGERDPLHVPFRQALAFHLVVDEGVDRGTLTLELEEAPPLPVIAGSFHDEHISQLSERLNAHLDAVRLESLRAVPDPIEVPDVAY